MKECDRPWFLTTLASYNIMFNFQQSHEQYEMEDHQIMTFVLSPLVENIDHNLISPAASKILPVAAAGGGKKKKQKRQPSENQENKKAANKNIIENKQKKSNHCEIEKQRRKEMADLYASLRNLIPSEYIKGKRSTSDHIHEAVNYINHLQKSICELQLKKEMLSKNPNSSTGVSGNAMPESCSSRRPSTVTVNLCHNGVEILISFTPLEEVFPVSRVLKKLLVLSLNVISYMSTSSNDGSTLYKIISEVDDPSCINIIGLQKTLTDTIMQHPTSL